jgi:tetratricopeptide (TPR) repeat protein
MRPLQPDKPIEPVKLTDAERLRIQRDQLEQMRKELETLLEPETDSRTQPKPKPKPESTPQAPEKKTPSTETKSALPPLPSSSSDTTKAPSAETEKPVESVDKPFRLPSPEQRTRIRQLLGPYKNFDALTADKAADYLQQGDQFMVKRQYYRAADAYTVATVWQSNDPQIYLKQSFALFAAGAYLSSAQSLQQALYLKPELGGEKIDLLNRLGGKIVAPIQGQTAKPGENPENLDLYQNRMREVIKFQKDSDSGMLALLMSYLYYQEGNLAKAQDNIVISAHYFPGDPAVTAMQKVVSPDAAPSKATP